MSMPDLKWKPCFRLFIHLGLCLPFLLNLVKCGRFGSLSLPIAFITHNLYLESVSVFFSYRSISLICMLVYSVFDEYLSFLLLILVFLVVIVLVLVRGRHGEGEDSNQEDR